MNKAFKWIFVVAAALMAPIFMLSNGAFAASTEDVFKKVLVNNVSSCYQKVLKGTSYEGYKKSGFNSLIGKSNPSFYVPSISDNQNKITETDKEGGRIATCDALFLGDGEDGWVFKSGLSGSMKSLFDIYGKAVPSSGQPVSVVNDFMRGTMQYTINTGNASSEGYCYTVYLGTTSTKLGEGCMNGNSYGADAKLDINDEKGDGYTVTSGHGANSTIASKGSITVKKEGSECFASVFTDFTEPPKFSNGSSIIEIDSSDRTYGKVGSCGLGNNKGPAIRVEIKKSNNTAENSEKVSYKKVNNNWTNFITALTGESYDSFAVSDAEKYDLYLAYLSNNYGMNGIPVVSSNCQASRPSNLKGGGKYYVFGGDSGWCEANLDPGKVKDNNSAKMTVFEKGNNRTMTKVITGLDELIEFMGALNYSDPSAFGGGEKKPQSSLKDTCGNSGAVASLGWIVCPLLDWMSGAVKGLYDSSVKPSLEIQPTLFTDQGGGGAEEGWAVFQTIANGVFIILLLVVIFSQLTGTGIDNYGIKKILPKLIVAAILVNLSFYICLVFVDISNIVGNSIQSLFDNLGRNMDIDYSVFNVNNDDGGGGVGATIMSVALLSTAVGGAAWVFWSNPAVVLSLLVSALGVIIAIFFLFVLLAAREAAVVVLAVISPLAFVCYMLPNTKKFFDRWLKIFEGLLLVYPICGLLVSGGNYVSRLLLSSGFANDSFVKALTAMIVGIVPIFFIPSVLRGSFSAMGNLGAKITGFGDRLRGGVDKRIRNTDAYKNAQERGMERRTRIRAGLDENGKSKELGSFGRFIRGGDRNIARSRAQYLKNQDTRNRERSLNGVGFEAATIGLQKRAEKDDLMDYITLINDATRNGEDNKKLYDMYEKYMKEGNKSGAVAVARIAGRRKDTAADFLSNKITGQSFIKDKDGNIIGENLTDAAKNYDSKMLSSVMKEIATGENSGTYRTSAPLGFEFAAQYNRAYKNEYQDGDVRPEANYSAWRNQPNVNTTLGNYITNSQELVGAKNSSLSELVKLMDSEAMKGSAEFERVRRLANETINDRDKTGVWDTTKAENIYKLAGREAEYKAMTAPKPEGVGEDFDNNSLYLRGPDGSQKPPIE